MTMASRNRKMRQRPVVDRRRGQRAKKCPVTGKRSWSSFNGALEAAAKLGGKAGKPARPYQCEHCGRWHLTSRPGSP